MHESTNTLSSGFVRIAVMLNIERNYARGILRGIETYCSSRVTLGSGTPTTRWQLAVYPLSEILHSQAERRKMQEWRPDGILAQINSKGLAKFCAQFRKPVVQLMHPTAWSGFPSVGLDDLAVGRKAADYFLQKGYRNFGYFELTQIAHFATPWLRWNELRKEGFLRRVEEFFKQLPGRNVLAPQVSIFSDAIPTAQRQTRKHAHRHTERRITKWFASLPPHTAIFCGCDDWAVVMLRAVQAIQIPEHPIAVLGVDDDSLYCNLVDPPLSSIVTGDERVGREASKVLDAMLNGAPAPKDPILLAPLGVTERQSSNTTVVPDADVCAAINYIKDHAMESLSVKQLVPHLSVNRRTLEMKFQRILGRSPADEIHRVRLEHLKILLRSDLSIRQIVQRMDYSSSQYLARTFKRDTGMSLTQYRRTIARGS